MGSIQGGFRVVPRSGRMLPSSRLAGGCVAYAADRLAHVALTDMPAPMPCPPRRWHRSRDSCLAAARVDGTRSRVRSTRNGLEGWLAVDNLRSTPSAVSAPIEPPRAATRSAPVRAMESGDSGHRFGQRADGRRGDRGDGTREEQIP